MSIRGGRGPRDEDRGGIPSWRASDGRGAPPVSRRSRYEQPEGRHIPGVLRFLIFAGILAAVVLVTALTALRPIVRAGVVGWAWDNPNLILRVPFVDQLVREDLGDKLTTANPGDDRQALFKVQPDDTVVALGPRLEQQGFVADQRAFIYVALANDLPSHLQAGDFLLRHNMTPADLVVALVRGKVQMATVPITFREGLRLEQMTALLETVESNVDPKAFYELAKHPTPKLLADYPWLKTAGLPSGASLEGFLYPATYTLITATNGAPFKVTDADALVRMLLDRFHEAVGDDRLQVPSARKLTFYQVLTLASIVEHESPLDTERPLVAGVYQNRLDGVNGVAKVLNADPTVIYAVDTTKLANTPIEQWKDFFFWEVPKGKKMVEISLPKALAGYQTYLRAGLPPGPIATPTTSSIDAALKPNQKDKYLYFVAIPNTQTHAFAKTLEEHNANLRKYGYL